ncbi:MAG TPA: beta-phosphoglucomutase [Kofleriaceae bacterium]|nr:beta-phosphoglucomutase [Kofleriaceae bacterium]
MLSPTREPISTAVRGPARTPLTPSAAGPSPGAIRGVIFDLDGVLVDTAHHHFRAWQRLADELHIAFTRADNERLKGVSRMRSLDLILELGGVRLDDAARLAAAERKNAWYLELIAGITPNDLLPGVAAFLGFLRERGVKIALGSASKNAAAILDKLGVAPLFDAVVHGGHVTRAKPDPEIFLTAARALGVPATQCVVFEDASAGVEAGKRAGMTVIGVGDPAVLTEADLVIAGFPALSFPLVIDDATPADFVLATSDARGDAAELHGSKFLLGNGYLGYRGTLEEDGAARQVAITVAGLYDQVGEAWREPVNAPNGLFTVVSAGGEVLDARALAPARHQQTLDLRRAVHGRDSVFHTRTNEIAIRAERFVSLDDVHLTAMRYQVKAARAERLVIRTGIDGAVWDLNGPHLVELDAAAVGDRLVVHARSHEGHRLAVVEAIELDAGTQRVISDGKAALREITIDAEPGREYTIVKRVSVFTSRDGVASPEAAARAHSAEVARRPYRALYLRHAHAWEQRWSRSDVVIGGDPEAQFALRYSLYQLYLAAPAHTDTLSIPARGLSGQTYKGAIFWDTEMFMLPFFLFTNPALARNLVKYRCHTLDGARRKAAEYGFRGAFYAWESQDTGDDACTSFNVTDVFTGRPLRTYFRDKQIHISADVVYGIWQYCEITGDDSVLFEGGAEVILECARFFYAYAYFKHDKRRFELLDVTGPDEYHERVNNNAFTNAAVKHSLDTALRVVARLEHAAPAFCAALLDRLAIRDELAAIAAMAEALYVPAPDPESLVIPQFDGYDRLEDVSVAALKRRIQNPNEYLGGGAGLATTTKVIKQADVAVLLHVFKHAYSHEVKRANWEYYEPRTEHGSSLSACIYALVAADIGRADWAYGYFMKTATIDLTGDYKRFVGPLYIGGTHPAANGGAWMAAVLGFGGLGADGDVLAIKPALPATWSSIAYRARFRGGDFRVEVTAHEVTVRAAADNPAAARLDVAGTIVTLAPGASETVRR